MKTIFIISIILICVYLTYIFFALTKYHFITYSDIDLNKNGILSFHEINYILNSEIRYKCYTDNTEYTYCKEISNKKKYKKIVLEVFSLKDGLPIKKVIIK